MSGQGLDKTGLPLSSKMLKSDTAKPQNLEVTLYSLRTSLTFWKSQGSPLMEALIKELGIGWSGVKESDTRLHIGNSQTYPDL